MIVAAAQIRSTPGDIRANIDLHLAAIELSAHNGAGMVVFPELSLTGYEPSLAGELAFEHLDDCLQIFRDTSERVGVAVGIGIPTKTSGKPRISQMFFRPNLEDVLYSKQHLHEDELPFFAAGDEQACLETGNETVVPAICYEALVPEHAAYAAELGATAYLVCVAKSQRSTMLAHTRLSEAARRHGLSVLFCNAVGRSDNFVSAGSSAAWNRKGEKLACAGTDEQCVLLVDLDSDEATIEPLKSSK